MSETQKKSQGKGLEEFIINLGKIAFFILRISWHGIRLKILGNFDRVLGLIVWICLLFISVYWDWMYLQMLHRSFPGVFTIGLITFLVYHVPRFMQFLVLSGSSISAIGLAVGVVDFIRMRQIQNELRHIGLKSATGLEPKVLSMEEVGPFRKKVTLLSMGVGLEQYKNKKSDLESTFGAIVEDISISKKSRKLVEISLAEKELPTLVHYKDCVSSLQTPYSFVVGESLGGILTQSIRSLPHLLIAGTSGNGKSVFFNQTLISLLKTSPHIQMVLLDLKLGVEVKAYSDLPNVSIAKNAAEAVTLLKSVKKEMEDRFILIENQSTKIIIPEVHDKDLILVGVDEASVLYGKKRGDKSGNDLISLARDLTDEIAKLGRSACIHLIVATQKVTNETIDTRIQENVGGRVCFRVNTLQGSNTVLGNKKAYELCEVKGRAIWGYGNEFIEVQTPFVSDKVIEAEISIIKDEFKTGKRKCLQSLVATGKVATAIQEGKINVIQKTG